MDRDAESLERLKSLCDTPERLCPIVADVSTQAIRPDAEVRHPGIEELTPEIWDRFFAIFVRAPVILTRLTLPLMREARFGRIVNNTTSYRTMLRVLPYGPAKAALESMSAVWAKELEGSPITQCRGLYHGR